MKPVLVDTSVWVLHFRQSNQALVKLLEQDAVRMHPLILGELACGTPPERTRTLAALAVLQPVQQASLDEIMAFIDREKLYGLGCGLVDLSLLAAVLLSPGTVLWTLDKRLCVLAERFGVLHQPQLH
jgi:predicted nucleic acid-binding protein